MIIFLNRNFSFHCLKHTQNTAIFLFIFYKNKFFWHYIIKNYFFINFYIKYIYFYKKLISNSFFTNLIKSWELFTLKKYLIYGKGYKFKKQKKKTSFIINTSHFNIIFFNQTIIQKLTKKKFNLILKSSMNIKLLNFLQTIHALNIFIKKLLKKSRTILLKKKKKQ